MTATLILAAGKHKNGDFGPHQLWEWIESHAMLVYPAISLLIVGLIVGALLGAMRSTDLNAEERSRLKKELMLLLRRRVSGLAADQAAAELQVDIQVAATLLGELQQEGLVTGSRSTPVQYRIRGQG